MITSCVWDPYTKANINKLEMVQRRTAVTDMLNELGWDTLQEQRQVEATMFYQILYGLVCVLSTPVLIPTPVSATRGHNMQFAVAQW